MRDRERGKGREGKTKKFEKMEKRGIIDDKLYETINAKNMMSIIVRQCR